MTVQCHYPHYEGHYPGHSIRMRLTIWTYRLIRLTLAMVFIISGLAKLRDPQHFALIIEAYGLIPEPMILPTALGLALTEVLAGVGLLADLQWSLGTITALLLLFMLILSYGLWLGLDVDCGCFSLEDPEGRVYHGLRSALYRDAGMLAGIGFLFVGRQRQALQPVRLSHLYQRFIKRR